MRSRTNNFGLDRVRIALDCRHGRSDALSLHRSVARSTQWRLTGDRKPAPAVVATIISRAVRDHLGIAFGVEARRGRTDEGRLLVRMDGEWVEAPLTTLGPGVAPFQVLLAADSAPFLFESGGPPWKSARADTSVRLLSVAPLLSKIARTSILRLGVRLRHRASTVSGLRFEVGQMAMLIERLVNVRPRARSDTRPLRYRAQSSFSYSPPIGVSASLCRRSRPASASTSGSASRRYLDRTGGLRSVQSNDTEMPMPRGTPSRG
jgi:hypothetical protein